MFNKLAISKLQYIICQMFIIILYHIRSIPYFAAALQPSEKTREWYKIQNNIIMKNSLLFALVLMLYQLRGQNTGSTYPENHAERERGHRLPVKS